MRMLPNRCAALIALVFAPALPEFERQRRAAHSAPLPAGREHPRSRHRSARWQAEAAERQFRSAGRQDPRGRTEDRAPDARSRLSGEKRWSFPKGFATAGFVDMHSSLGAGNELAEKVVSFFPTFDAAEAYDPAYPGWTQLAPRGVTSLVLAPERHESRGRPRRLPAPGAGLARPEASYMKFSLTRSMLNREREPTSLLGATDLLKRKYGLLEDPNSRRCPGSWIPAWRASRRPSAASRASASPARLPPRSCRRSA